MKHFVVATVIPSIMLFGWLHNTWAEDNAAMVDEIQAARNLPGGFATSRQSRVDSGTFSQPSGNLDFNERFTFNLGRAVFRKLWVSSPSTTRSSDGLGPLYNARSCARCHKKNGRGHPPDVGDNAISMVMRLSVPRTSSPTALLTNTAHLGDVPEPIYGRQLQDFAIQGHDAEGEFKVAYIESHVTLADGTVVSLRTPRYRFQNLKYGPMRKDVQFSPRIANQMIGLGLLEAVSPEDILSFEDPEDKDADGISGRANRVWSLSHKRLMLGRFGWKAGQPTLMQQIADAFSGDLGLSTPIFRATAGDCTPTQDFCRNAPHGAEDKDEVNKELLDLVTFYVRTIAVPQRRNAKSPAVRTGHRLFRHAGCAQCHRPRMTTGMKVPIKSLQGQIIWPYTDLLLHDMGEGLADNRPEAAASGREWRTPPLWGIGLTKTVTGRAFFLHDGRARSVEEAILWHGGEAERARNFYAQLSVDERTALVAFVNSL